MTKVNVVKSIQKVWGKDVAKSAFR